jgi:hypothetical protein
MENQVEFLSGDISELYGEDSDVALPGAEGALATSAYPWTC